MPLSGVFPQPAAVTPALTLEGASRRAGPPPLMDRLGLPRGRLRPGQKPLRSEV